MRRLALVLVSALLLAACGGGSKTGGDATAQIKSAYEKFFSSKTALATRIGLLQHGSSFTPVISALAKNPLARDTSATVSSVTLEGADHAKVVFTVNVSGNPLLKNVPGTAVRTGGKWKVGYASLCKLIALEGPAPAACHSG